MKTNRISIPCQYCGMPLALTPSRIDASKFGPFCDQGCFNAWQRENPQAYSRCRSAAHGLRYSAKQEEFVVGTVLGDGHLARTDNTAYRNSFLRIEQKEYQYTAWKKEQLGPLAPGVLGQDSSKGHWYFYSATHPRLNYFREMFYPDNMDKIIPEEALDYLSPYALAVLFMDDGWYKPFGKGKGFYLQIATSCFTDEDNALLADHLQDVYDLRARIYHCDGYPVFSLDSPSSKRFRDIVEPHIIPCMRYKLGY